MDSVRECIQLDLRNDPGSERVNGIWRDVHGRDARVPVFEVPTKNVEEKCDSDQSYWDAHCHAYDRRPIAFGSWS